eukprot:Opistho-1_new@50854
MAPRKVLVTGAGGFIGKQVAFAFRRAGFKVAGLVRDASKAGELRNNEISIVVGDITNPAGFESEIASSDVLVHCAHDYTTGLSSMHPLRDRFAAAAKSGKTVVWTSGIWLYGDVGDAFVTEKSTPNFEMLKERVVNDDIIVAANGIVVRPPCVYGGAGGPVGVLIEGGLKSKKVPLMGDGNNWWSHIHVYDLARFYVQVAESGQKGLFNVAEDGSARLIDYVRAIAKATGAEIVPVPTDSFYFKGMSLSIRIDASHAKKTVGWSAVMPPFLESVDDYIAAFKANNGLA